MRHRELSGTFQYILSRSEKVKPLSSGSFNIICPCHDDKEPSLTITLAKDKILLHCKAGCNTNDIIHKLGLEIEDLFPENNNYYCQNYGTSVDKIAKDKYLSVDLLKKLGVKQISDTDVQILYYDIEGSGNCRQRIRTNVIAKEGSRWEENDKKVVPYGLWKLEEAYKRGFIIVCEGESDCWTLWKYGYPAMGLPGAGMTGKLEINYIDNIPKVFIIHEYDEGGQKFLEGIIKRLKDINYIGEAFEINMTPEYNDINDLYKKNKPAFPKTVDELLRNANLIYSTQNEYIPIVENSKLKLFPIEIYSTPLKNMIIESAEVINCPVDFLAVATLIILSVVVGSKHTIQIKKGWEEKPILFAAIVAEPGSK